MGRIDLRWKDIGDIDERRSELIHRGYATRGLVRNCGGSHFVGHTTARRKSECCQDPPKKDGKRTETEVSAHRRLSFFPPHEHQESPPEKNQKPYPIRNTAISRRDKPRSLKSLHNY